VAGLAHTRRIRVAVRSACPASAFGRQSPRWRLAEGARAEVRIVYGFALWPRTCLIASCARFTSGWTSHAAPTRRACGWRRHLSRWTPGQIQGGWTPGQIKGAVTAAGRSPVRVGRPVEPHRGRRAERTCAESGRRSRSARARRPGRSHPPPGLPVRRWSRPWASSSATGSSSGPSYPADGSGSAVRHGRATWPRRPRRMRARRRRTRRRLPPRERPSSEPWKPSSHRWCPSDLSVQVSVTRALSPVQTPAAPRAPTTATTSIGAWTREPPGCRWHVPVGASGRAGADSLGER
jgi:hypothetical protein